MLRLIVAILAAPIVWGVVMFGGFMLIGMVYPDAGTSGPFPLGYLLLSLIGSVIYSLVSGFVSGAIAGGDARRVGLGAGIALLVVGLAAQIANWALWPVWYHVIFLALLIPAAMVGVRMYTQRQAAAV